MEHNNKNTVAADPAKGFFVYMLVKDITLRDAIGDLVDNAVDAIKEKTTDRSNLSGYKINIEVNEESFSISDNGFGMKSSVARETAFNFGKSPIHNLIDNSIGQFGIGMKRAFFKMGNVIQVKSVSSDSDFQLTINVSEWLGKDEWEFHFDEGTLHENVVHNINETMFSVKISTLSDDSKTSFKNEAFIDQLRREIALEHMLNIGKGLEIVINGYRLKEYPISLVLDDIIKPTYWRLDEPNRSVEILAGISSYNSEEGGWNIFCNERLILSRNKGPETVWTGSKGDGVPMWHSQYYRFRGYVFFSAKDSSELPWNTTKNGMDMDSPYYKRVRSEMIVMTRQVMDLMDKLKEERSNDNPEDNQILNKAVSDSLKNESAVPEVLSNPKTLSNKFVYPELLFNPAKRSNVKRIAYSVSKEKFEEVQSSLNVNTTKDVGLGTFNYYYENEV